MTAWCRPPMPADPSFLLQQPPFLGSRALAPPVTALWAERCRYAVALPARDEETAIGGCLDALVASMRRSRRQGGLVVLVNNSSDATYARACSLLADSGIAHLVLDVAFPDDLASAGTARRLALDLASALVDPLGALMTTDADTIVGPDWVGANLAAIGRGADVVCGALDVDPDEAAPVLARMGPGYRFEREYVDLTIELGARLDPRTHDPLPPHRCAGGASLACRQRVYRDTGGMPAIASGEDRAFVAAAEARDFRVTYSADARVTTSFRLDGRAVGGMATTLAARLAGDHAPCDEFVEPAARAALRAWARGRLRRAAGRSSGIRQDVFAALGLGAGNDLAGSTRYFGETWNAIEASSPRLVRQRISLDRVAGELPAMRNLVMSLREDTVVPATAAEASRWIAGCCGGEVVHG